MEYLPNTHGCPTWAIFSLEEQKEWMESPEMIQLEEDLRREVAEIQMDTDLRDRLNPN